MEWIIVLIIGALMVAAVVYLSKRVYCNNCHRFAKIVTTEVFREVQNQRIRYKEEAVCPKCGKVLYVNYYWEDM